MTKVTFLVTDSVSGESRKVKAETPVKALIDYLKAEVEPNPHNLEWDWDFHVMRIRR